uniref:Transmembrane protein 43 n=1 Tax=Ciona savignyi TaxID=51511 RepID=H2Z2Q8_CIOSA
MPQRTYVTYRRRPGFLERIGHSCTGVIGGMLVVLLAVVMLYYNEGHSVATAEMLEEGLSLVQPLYLAAKSNLNGVLVHHIGLLEAENELYEDHYKFSVPCVKLRRKVEMFQWVEHSHSTEVSVGDSIKKETTYTYDTEWSETLSNSRNFDEEIGHVNPRDFLLESKTKSLQVVNCGGTTLSSHLVDQIDWFVDIIVPPGVQSTHYKRYIYHGEDPMHPVVGDTRVSFQCAGITGKSELLGERDAVSIIASYANDALTTFRTSNGRSISFLRRGPMTAEQMFRLEESNNNKLTWFIRLAGFVLMYVGLMVMTRIITTLVDWIPVLRQIVSFSVSMWNLSLAAFLTILTIAISWLRF